MHHGPRTQGCKNAFGVQDSEGSKVICQELVKYWSWRPLECAGFWQPRPFELTHYCTKILSDDSYSFWSTSFRDSKMSSKSDFEANYYPSKKIAKWVWFTTFKFYFYYVLNHKFLVKLFIGESIHFCMKQQRVVLLSYSHKAKDIQAWESWGLIHHFVHLIYYGIQICKDSFTYKMFLWMKECATHISGFLEWTCAVKP